MPTLSITRNYSDGNTLTATHLNDAMSSVETFVNSTKLDGSNLQASSVDATQLAANAVTTAKMSANSVTLAKLAAEITAQLVPTGSVLPYVGTSAPSGFLLCDGSAVSRTTYSALFAVCGVAHGSGDGATTFNVPDYRGRFLRGKDGGAGRDLDASSRTAMASGGATGDNIGSIQGNATKLPNTSFTTATDGIHYHSLNVVGGTNAQSGTTRTEVGTGTINTATDGAHQHTVSGGGDNETRPVNAAVNYLVKT